MSRRSDRRFVFWPFRLRNGLKTRLFRLLFASSFKAFGRSSNILLPDGIEGASDISIGNGVVVGGHTYLAARPIEKNASVSLVIGDGVRLGRFNHVYATKRIEIGPRVLTANNVYIADNTHTFDNPDIAIFDQPLAQLDQVSIGAGTWIGHGACIIGARVGRNCVIGAGAFVRRDIPDHCVAVGAPARIIKRYDIEAKIWRRCLPTGEFDHKDD